MDGDLVYISDTGHHAIQVFDRRSKTFKKLDEPLNSPWDLVKAGDSIFIAAAGSHQIWALEIPDGPLYPFAGNGSEGITDGPLTKSNFAQPSGIAADGARTLYIADSETSAIRKIDLFAREVHTLIGQGLVDFGDRDGDWDDAFLQHPLGVDFFEGRVFVADSYNNKVKEISLITRQIETIFGEKGAFHEPAGVAFEGERLFVADTLSHQIRVCDLRTGQISAVPIH
jgi:sugar lactone lactonase YvrE